MRLYTCEVSLEYSQDDTKHFETNIVHVLSVIVQTISALYSTVLIQYISTSLFYVGTLHLISREPLCSDKLRIILTPHQHHGILIHQQFYCLLNSLSCKHRGKHQGSKPLISCEGYPLIPSRFPAHGTSNTESFFMPKTYPSKI